MNIYLLNIIAKWKKIF